MQLQSNAAPKQIELQKQDQSHFKDLFKIFDYLIWFLKFDLNLGFVKASVFFFYLSCTTPYAHYDFVENNKTSQLRRGQFLGKKPEQGEVKVKS